LYNSNPNNRSRELGNDEDRSSSATPVYDDEPNSNSTYPLRPLVKIQHEEEIEAIETVKRELLESETDSKQEDDPITNLTLSEDSEDSEVEPVGKWKVSLIKKIDDLATENKQLKATIQDLKQNPRSTSVPVSRQSTPDRLVTPTKSIRSRFSVAHLLSGNSNDTSRNKTDKDDYNLLRRRKSDADILKRKEETKPEKEHTTTVTSRFLEIRKKKDGEQTTTELTKLAKVSEQKTTLEKRMKEMDLQLDIERKRYAKEKDEWEKTRKKLEKENKELKSRGGSSTSSTYLSGLNTEKERPQEKQTTPRSANDRR